MKAFRFRLARVLRVRRLQEELARAALHEATGAARKARASAQAASAELELGRTTLRELHGLPRLEPAVLLSRYAALDAVQRTSELLEARARLREREAEERRTQALEARAGVRGLERLEERRRSAHAAERERAERAGLDELAQRRGAGLRRSSSPARPATEDTSWPARRPAGTESGPTGSGLVPSVPDPVPSVPRPTGPA